VDGKSILEIAFYGPDDHKFLKQELGAYWFQQEIELPFLGRYYGKFIAVIDYSAPSDYRMQGDTTKQIFGIGDTPEAAVKNALESFVKAYEPLLGALKTALAAL
jgi:hypothetical protein